MVGVIQLEWGQVQNKKQINYKQWELTSIRLFNLIWQYHLSLYVCVCVSKNWQIILLAFTWCRILLKSFVKGTIGHLKCSILWNVAIDTMEALNSGNVAFCKFSSKTLQKTWYIAINSTYKTNSHTNIRSNLIFQTHWLPFTLQHHEFHLLQRGKRSQIILMHLKFSILIDKPHIKFLPWILSR